MTPSHLVIFLKGDLLRMSSGLQVMLRSFCFSEFGVLELSKDDCWFHQVWCAWFILGLSEFSSLVNWLGLNLPCLLCLIFDFARSCCACFLFFFFSLFFSFLADTVPFIFFFSFSLTTLRFFLYIRIYISIYIYSYICIYMYLYRYKCIYIYIYI